MLLLRAGRKIYCHPQTSHSASLFRGKLLAGLAMPVVVPPVRKALGANPELKKLSASQVRLVSIELP